MSDHDGIYRRFFSHPGMVLDLLRHFVGGDWVEALEEDCLEMIPAHYVAEELEHREQDLVWRVRHGDDRSFFVYLLLEFQSSVDRFMALRLLVYLGLLYQDLVKQGELTPDRKLPPVLPLVLYNGETAWWAATEFADLVEVEVPELEAYQPRFQYRVIDEVHLPEELLAADSPVAGMIRVERSRTTGELRTSLYTLLRALDRSDLTAVAPDVETWLRRVIGPKRFRDLDLKSWKELRKVTTMLEERVRQWEKEFLVEGQAQGLRSALMRQFRLKFQRDLSAAESARVESADGRGIERLLEAILTAEEPSDLWGLPPKGPH